MEVGDRIKIYKDPQFEEVLEGWGVVCKILMEQKDMIFCIVKLESNKLEVERWIKKEVEN